MINLSKHALVMLFGTALAASGISAQAEPPTEYEVKAAFIHNIAKFIEMPTAARAAGTLRLCIAGQDPFGGALDALRGKPIGDRVWEIMPATPGSNLRECGALFISASARGNLRQMLDTTRGGAVLTMGDSEGYAEQGVIVNFYIEQGKVRFEINAEAASRAGFRISSQLMKLARIIAGPEGMK